MVVLPLSNSKPLPELDPLAWSNMDLHQQYSWCRSIPQSHLEESSSSYHSITRLLAHFLYTLSLSHTQECIRGHAGAAVSSCSSLGRLGLLMSYFISLAIGTLFSLAVICTSDNSPKGVIRCS